DTGGAAAPGRALWNSTRGSTLRRPTGHPPPGGQAAARPYPPRQPLLAPLRPRPRAHRSGRASLASGSTGPSQAASRRQSQISLRQQDTSAGRQLRSRRLPYHPRHHARADVLAVPMDRDRLRSSSRRVAAGSPSASCATVVLDSPQRRERGIGEHCSRKIAFSSAFIAGCRLFTALTPSFAAFDIKAAVLDTWASALTG